MPLVISTAPTATLSLDALLLQWTPLHWILCLSSCCVSTEPLVDVLCRLPPARYVDCWGHSMALGSVGHFPSEEQQWIDLWESSLSAECVRSCFPDPVHVLVFFCPQQHTVSTQLYTTLPLWKYISRGKRQHILCHLANDGKTHCTSQSLVR